MTVANTNNKTICAGDGISTIFSWTFQLPSGSTGSDIFLFLVDNLGNVNPVTSNYALNLGQGNLTYPVTPGQAPLPNGAAAVPVGWELVIVRTETIIQALNLVTQGSFTAASIMAAFDYLTMICQQLDEKINRATLAPINQPAAAAPIVPPTPVPVGLVQINGTWAQLVAYAQLNPTAQFLGYVNSGDLSGSQFFYCGDVTVGNQGFITVGGG